jgi:three-Cys-motif partner protein
VVVPTEVLWERDPHTAAKHTLLRRYLMAWFPIMAKQFRTEGITFLDGFAGPGEYKNSKESSPVIAMTQALRREVVEQQTLTRLVFIEKDKRRAEHLAALLNERFPPADRPTGLVAQINHGKVATLYEQAIAAVGGWEGPVFANLDGWGADTDYTIVKRVAKQQSSEVLVTFQDQFFTRFADVEEQEAGDRVFGFRDWREVANEPTSNKKPYLLDL